MQDFVLLILSIYLFSDTGSLHVRLHLDLYESDGKQVPGSLSLILLHYDYFMHYLFCLVLFTDSQPETSALKEGSNIGVSYKGTMYI